MFQFPSTTKVEQNLKLNDMYKLIKADKDLKAKSQNILSITIINAISELSTKLKLSSEIKVIYVIKIELNSFDVPYDFLKVFDKSICFNVLFILHCGDKVKYLISYKTTTDNIVVSQSKFFETEWISPTLLEMPLVNNLEDVYKEILANITKLKFRENETLKSWVIRFSEIEKLKKEFTKTEKLMQKEIQPKKQIQYNEKLRELYKKIKELK